jgi:hypothetical protein
MLAIGKLAKLATGNFASEDIAPLLASLGVRNARFVKVLPKDLRGEFDNLATSATAPGAEFVVITGVMRDGTKAHILMVCSK